jgi:hypothetical protein
MTTLKTWVSRAHIDDTRIRSTHPAQTTVAALFGVTAFTINHQLRNLLRLLEQDGTTLQPTQTRPHTLDEPHHYAKQAGITTPQEIESADGQHRFLRLSQVSHGCSAARGFIPPHEPLHRRPRKQPRAAHGATARPDGSNLTLNGPTASPEGRVLQPLLSTLPDRLPRLPGLATLAGSRPMRLRRRNPGWCRPRRKLLAHGIGDHAAGASISARHGGPAADGFR